MACLAFLRFTNSPITKFCSLLRPSCAQLNNPKYTTTQNIWSDRMTTFTIRVPQSMAGRLSSAQMRTWIIDFLRAPGELPRDPGPGEGRISLTLHKELVKNLAARWQCSPSIFLRRFAIFRLGSSEAPMKAARITNSSGGTERSFILSSQSHDEIPTASSGTSRGYFDQNLCRFIYPWSNDAFRSKNSN